jgi:hypothetical protein
MTVAMAMAIATEARTVMAVGALTVRVAKGTRCNEKSVVKNMRIKSGRVIEMMMGLDWPVDLLTLAKQRVVRPPKEKEKEMSTFATGPCRCTMITSTHLLYLLIASLT